MAIGLQKLSAGSGYEYLTRQVAAMDATGRGHSTLADYYSAKGEAPGHWYGGGLTGVGLAPGDPVTAEQMKLLFGAGLDPVTGDRLGRRFAVYGNEPTSFDAELDRRLAMWQAEHLEPVPRDVRDGVRTTMAREWFAREYGREPSGPRELYGFIVKATTQARTSVAGFDLTLTPPKSVSALWALAGPELAAAIRAAHHAAVADAMTSAERRVVFTRQGRDGARHIEVRGLLAAAFLHRDSRAGDPNLHTHVAISNKVQTQAGDWLAIDAQVLYRAKVSLSETYTTSLQARLTRLGLSFVATGRDGKRPVYEIVGLDPRLLARWSSRRRQVTARTAELVGQFVADHERPPTPLEKLNLAQQATLETRQAKHQPHSETQQRASWHAEAEDVLGPGGTVRLLTRVLAQPRSVPPRVDDALTRSLGQRVITMVESERSSWTPFHVRAEALRQVRAAGVGLDDVEETVDRIVRDALSPERSVAIATTRTMPVEPASLRRRDGESVYVEPTAGHYTSQRILWAEQRLVDTAGRTGGRQVDANSVTLALLQSLANHEPLNAGQQALVQEMATSGRRLQLAIAPAGTGKTTAMRALACAWTSSGGNVVGLAPSAAAAEQLRTHLHDDASGAATDNLAKLVWAIGHGEELGDQVGSATLVIIDEAGMADTLTLDHVVTWCCDRGASVRLIGDDQQLGAIGAGGVLRDIAATHGAVRLEDVMRFADPAEAAASVALRAGDTGGLGFYLDNGRVHVVDPDTAIISVLSAWRADRAAGLDALMLAPTRAQVAELNHAARAERLDGSPPGRETVLADGNLASSGDVVISRRNNRTLTTGATAWVRNGDRWSITKVHHDGALDVWNQQSHAQLTLPAAYVATSVELGYATTIHGAQGVTADTCHGLLTGTESRQQAYTMLTRGRYENHAWVLVTDADSHPAPAARSLLAPATATRLLEGILERDDAPISATTLLLNADDPALLLGPAVTCYLDALGFATEHHVDQATKDALDAAGQAQGLTDADAWPTLRSQLMMLAANGHDPSMLVTYPARARLEAARDRVAVLSHRLSLAFAADLDRGPLPWLPGIPFELLENPEWNSYLSARHELTRQLAEETRHATDPTTPAWASDLPELDRKLMDDVRVWRAAHSIPDSDLRPTGPACHGTGEKLEQRRLDRRVESAHDVGDWMTRIVDAAPAVAGDARLPVLAGQLMSLNRRGYDATGILNAAISTGELPDDHPADALTFRISRLVPPEPVRSHHRQADEGHRHLAESQRQQDEMRSLYGDRRGPGISI